MAFEGIGPQAGVRKSYSYKHQMIDYVWELKRFDDCSTNDYYKIEALSEWVYSEPP